MAKLNKKGVSQALEKMHGNISAAARALGVTRRAIRRWIEKDAALQEFVEDCRETMGDDAETSLGAAIIDGESWAVLYMLNTPLMKSRGLGKTPLEIGGADGAPIKVDHDATEILKVLTALDAAISAGADQTADERGVRENDITEPLHPEEAAPV